MMSDFIRDQKNINTQVNQKIDHVETSFNKKFDSFQANLIYKKLIICNLPSLNSQACIWCKKKENSLHNLAKSNGSS